MKKLLKYIKDKRNSNNFVYIILFGLYDLHLEHISFTEITNPKYYNPDTKKYESLRKEFSKKRKLGISGFMRIHNEEETIENVILSCIGGLDELIICLNNCFDRTEGIVKRLIKKYPDKIKLYYYNYDIFPACSKNHQSSKFNNIRNLANFYNYTLHKCTFQYAVKIDGDDLMTKDKFENICKLIKKNGLKKYLGFFGLNLYKYENEIYFFGNELIAGGYDRGFFKINRYTYYLKDKSCEVFKFSKLFRLLDYPLYFHLKLVKKDKGLLNHSLSKKEIVLSDTLKERYSDRLNKSFEELNLLTFRELVKKYPQFKSLKLPKEYKVEK